MPNTKYCDNCQEEITGTHLHVEDEKEISVDGMGLMDVPVDRFFCDKVCKDEFFTPATPLTPFERWQLETKGNVITRDSEPIEGEQPWTMLERLADYEESLLEDCIH